MLKPVILFCTALLVMSCSEEPGEEILSEEHPQMELVISDTIGIEMGDSNYVFGTVIDAAFLPDGNIALLDVRKARISVFSSLGEFLYSFGMEGNGPGEFLEPSSIDTYPDGSFAVTAPTAGKVIIYDSALCFQREITWPHNCPLNVCAADSGRVIGIQFDYYAEGEAMYVGRRLCYWSGSSDPEIVLRSGYVPAEGMSADLPSYTFDTTSEGMTVSAYNSEEEYDLMMQDTSGDTLFHIQEEIEGNVKTDEELEFEHMPYRSNSAGFTDSEIRSMTERWEPSPCRYAIRNVCVDHLDRIWVLSGVRDDPSPLFQVYDLEGSLLASVQTDFSPTANNWKFVFGDSTALAFDTNPEDYSKVLMLEIVEE